MQWRDRSRKRKSRCIRVSGASAPSETRCPGSSQSCHALPQTWPRRPLSILGALIIRIGFGGILYYTYNNKKPPNPILIIQAPTLLEIPVQALSQPPLEHPSNATPLLLNPKTRPSIRNTRSLSLAISRWGDLKNWSLSFPPGKKRCARPGSVQ